MFRDLLLPITMLAIGCAEPNMTPGTSEPSGAGDAPLANGVSVTIKGHEGNYVACELDLEGEDKAILVANRSTPGDWERFTMYTKADGRVVFRAANGKFVCSDEYRGGLLVADRDQPGDWETFTLIPQPDGKVALQTRNGSYITADYGLEGSRRGALFGDRTAIKEWEQFTLEKDTVPLP